MEWRKLQMFRGIDLNDSFVLDWMHDNDHLTFVIEASIWPESEYYIEPKNDEYTCYRRASLEFLGVSNVIGLKPQESIVPSIDPDGSKDYGNIDDLQVFTGSSLIKGNFGSVNVQGGELRLEIRR